MGELIYIKKDGHRRRVERRAFEAHWQRLGYEVVEPKPARSRGRKVKEEPKEDNSGDNAGDE